MTASPSSQSSPTSEVCTHANAHARLVVALRDASGGDAGLPEQPRLLEWAASGELDPSFLATHRLTLEDGAKGYDLFKHNKDGCVRVVFTP